VELLRRKSGSSGIENREYGRGDPSHRPHDTLYLQKLALTSPTSGGRSVGIVRSRTQATEFVCFIGRVQENQVEPKLNETYQLLAYADDVNLLGDNIDSIQKHRENVIDPGKVGLNGKAEKRSICCCLITRMQVKIMT
jgi:hypothetical protein